MRPVSENSNARLLNLCPLLKYKRANFSFRYLIAGAQVTKPHIFNGSTYQQAPALNTKPFVHTSQNPDVVERCRFGSDSYQTSSRRGNGESGAFQTRTARISQFVSRDKSGSDALGSPFFASSVLVAAAPLRTKASRHCVSLIHLSLRATPSCARCTSALRRNFQHVHPSLFCVCARAVFACVSAPSVLFPPRSQHKLAASFLPPPLPHTSRHSLLPLFSTFSHSQHFFSFPTGKICKSEA